MQLEKGATEPDRRLVFRDTDGDFWWFSVDYDEWVWSHYLVNIGEQGKGIIAGGWPMEAASIWPLTQIGWLDGSTLRDGMPVTVTPVTLQDSGARSEFPGGGVRDSSVGKPRFDLLFPQGVPYEAQFLTQMAAVLEAGAQKYAPRNWEMFHTTEALEHAQASLGRHYANYMAGSTDEPHLFLMGCNLLMIATIEWKIENGWTPEKKD